MHMNEENKTVSFNTNVWSQNDTIPPSEMRGGILIYYYSIFTVITVVTFLGNFVVIVTICRHAPMRNSMSVFIVSLAVSDLMFALSYPIYNLTQVPGTLTAKVFSSSVACRAILIIVQWIEFNSAYHLVAITFTRYLSIMRPLQFQIWLTEKTALVSVAVIWIITFALSSSVYGSAVADMHLGFCRFEKVFSEGHALFLCFVTMIIPGTLMVILYGLIVRVARQQAKKIMASEVSQTGPSGKKNLIKRELKSAMIVSLLVGFFVAAWSPLAIFIIYTTICKCTSHVFFRTTFRLIVYTNYAINVFIYAGRMSEFRRYVKQDFCCIWNNTTKITRVRSVSKTATSSFDGYTCQ